MSAAVFQALAAPLPLHAIEARMGGKPKKRDDGTWAAMFLLYVRAQYVVTRLDAHAPGDWSFHASDPHPFSKGGNGGEDDGWYVKGALTVLGCTREDYGQGKDPKEAATDALKRCAVRFGIAAELYYARPLWVTVDGDGKFAKPKEPPLAVYLKKYGALPTLPSDGEAPDEHDADAPRETAKENGDRGVKGVAQDGQYEGNGAAPGTSARSGTGATGNGSSAPTPTTNSSTSTPAPSTTSAPAATRGGSPASSTPTGSTTSASDNPPCPKCGGRMWDNRVGKRNPKAPDFKCRTQGCDGVIWPPRAKKESRQTVPSQEEWDGYADSHDSDIPF